MIFSIKIVCVCVFVCGWGKVGRCWQKHGDSVKRVAGNYDFFTVLGTKYKADKAML